MSEGLNDDSIADHRHGRYLLSGDIDGEELADACRRLGISGPLEPLLRELKNQQHHQYQDQNVKESSAAMRKQQQKSDRKTTSRSKEAIAAAAADEHTNELNKGGKNSSTYGQESWGRDSGARDLSPEPNHHHHHHHHHHSGGRVPAESSGTDSQLTDTETGTTSMIHLANKLQVAALSALKTEVLELSARLQHSERERECMQRKLTEALEEKERSQRRLDSISSAHESRLTEMHCVIVELTKKIKSKQDNAIIEEHEPDGSVSELSFQDGSVYNSEMECTNLEQESQTEPLDVKLIQPIRVRSDSPCSLPPPTTSTQVQIQTMHEEILHLRGQVALLQSQLASDRDKFDQEHNEISNNDNDLLAASPRDRSNYTSDDLCETAEIFEVPPHLDQSDQDFMRHAAKYIKTNKISQSRGVSPVVQLFGSVNSLNKSQQLHQKSLTTEIPVSRMADRVRLRRTLEEHHGADSGIGTTHVAEHLVSDLLQSDVEMTGGDSPQLLQTEVQRLHRRIEHLRIQNSVLSITLAESKAHCNHLYLLCGKYESNAVALHQALNCSDRAIEAYDVMLALLESRLGILEDAPAANESRQAAEAVAKHLMDRLDSEKNLHGTSLGPWQDAVVINANNSSNRIPWKDDDDQRLRGHVSKLKGQRASIQNTVVTLESPFCCGDDETKSSTDHTSQMNDNRRMDLETAVLMQELMSMREELGDYKYRAEQAEREKNNTIQRLSVMQEALLHLQAQLADSETLLAMNNRDRSSYSESEHSVGIERELVEALARESRLKARLQGLAGSLEAATKSSEEKYIQVQNTVSELKQTNLTLTQSLDRCKRKYQTRLRRLEQQMLELTINKKGNSAAQITTATHQSNAQLKSPMKNNVPETTL